MGEEEGERDGDGEEDDDGEEGPEFELMFAVENLFGGGIGRWGCWGWPGRGIEGGGTNTSDADPEERTGPEDGRPTELLGGAVGGNLPDEMGPMGKPEEGDEGDDEEGEDDDDDEEDEAAEAMASR